MQVDVDQLWVTPSTLHLRVIVWGDDHAWRHKYYVAVPRTDIDDPALEWMFLWLNDDVPEENHQDTPLF